MRILGKGFSFMVKGEKHSRAAPLPFEFPTPPSPRSPALHTVVMPEAVTAITYQKKKNNNQYLLHALFYKLPMVI